MPFGHTYEGFAAAEAITRRVRIWALPADFPGGSRAELARSLVRLSALDVEGLFAGHGEPTEENGSRCIAAAVALMKSGYG